MRLASPHIVELIEDRVIFDPTPPTFQGTLAQLLVDKHFRRIIEFRYDAEVERGFEAGSWIIIRVPEHHDRFVASICACLQLIHQHRRTATDVDADSRCVESYLCMTVECQRKPWFFLVPADFEWRFIGADCFPILLSA